MRCGHADQRVSFLLSDDTSALDGFAYKFSARPRDEELGKNLFFNKRRSENFYIWLPLWTEKISVITSPNSFFLQIMQTRRREWTMIAGLIRRWSIPSFHRCVGVEGSVWLRGEDSPCQLPCTGKISRGCGDLCSILDAGYKTVPAVSAGDCDF